MATDAQDDQTRILAKFDDGKDPSALRTIGEVTRALGIRQHVLRYWEEQFPALAPIKRAGGRRYYRPEDVALIVEIDRLVHHEGYTLRGAANALSRKPARSPRKTARAAAAPAVAAPEPAAETAADIDRELRALREGLAAALAAA